MYPWVTHTTSFIQGECPHNCSYCYVKRFPVGNLRLNVKNLQDNLGRGRTIFVGSSCDMFAKGVPSEWVEKVLEVCRRFDNTYLFQSKNPARFSEFMDQFPEKTILGTTIETNRDYRVSDAPKVQERQWSMSQVTSFETMVSVEPVLDFDLDILVGWLKDIRPSFVSIGADSKGNSLPPEPGKEKLEALLAALRVFTEVKVKENLKRLLKEAD